MFRDKAEVYLLYSWVASRSLSSAPQDACWNDLKVKALSYVNISVSLFWIDYMFIHLFSLCKYYVYLMYEAWKMSQVNENWGIVMWSTLRIFCPNFVPINILLLLNFLKFVFCAHSVGLGIHDSLPSQAQTKSPTSPLFMFSPDYQLKQEPPIEFMFWWAPLCVCTHFSPF